MKQVKLEDVCYAGSSNLSQKDVIMLSGNYPIYGASGFIRNINFYKCEEDYIAIVKDGSGVGRTMILPKKSSVIGTMQYIFPKNNINIKYLYYLLKSMNLERYKTGIAIPHIYFKDYKNAKFYLHTASEQKNIVNQLDKVQEIVEIRKKQIEEFDKLIKSQFVEMFGNIKDTKYEKKTLEELVDKTNKYSLKRGPFGGSLKKDDFVDSGYLVYEQRHAIHNDFEYEKYYIDEEKYNNMEMFKVIPGDLIISCSGVTLGRIAEIPRNAKAGIINQALLKITLNTNVMKNEFFIQQFRSEEIQNHLFGFSRGSGIPNFPSMNEVKKIEFICPNIELQNKYEKIVKQIDKQKFEIQKSLEETKKLQESLMNKYFGG